MKLSKTFSTAFIIISLSLTTTFAASDTYVSNKSKVNNGSIASHFKNENEKNCNHKHQDFDKDPIKCLENKKEEIKTLLKDGKITKEKADTITKKIDSRIKEIKEFDKLTLPQKKEKLITDFRVFLEKGVKEGKINKSQSDSLFKEFSEQVEQWDGKERFKFHIKRFKENQKKE